MHAGYNLLRHLCMMSFTMCGIHTELLWRSSRRSRGVKSEVEARGATSPLFCSWLSVLVLLSAPARQIIRTHISSFRGILLQMWLSVHVSSSFNTCLTEKTPPENIKEHARLHVHKGGCLPGKKRLFALHCICVCACRGRRKSLLPTKPHYLLSFTPEYIYCIYVEQTQT